MTEKQFGTMPVRRLFFHLILPSVMSRLFSCLYIMADGIVVGRWIGEHALAAVNLIMPVLSIIFALSDMIAVGSSVKISKTLGEEDPKKARELFSAIVMLIVGMGFVFMLASLLVIRPVLFRMIDDPVLADLSYRYAMVYVYTYPIIMPLFAMDNFLRACGKAKYCMWINVSVSLGNILLDVIFVLGFHWGVESTAAATVISMAAGSLFQFGPFFTKKLSLYFGRPRITLREVGRILYNGIAEFFGNTANALMAILVNALLLSLGGSVAVAAYSAVMYIDSLLISVLFGVADAIQPAISYNLGALKIKRTFAFFRISCCSMVLMSLVFLLVIVFLPDQLALAFSTAEHTEMIRMTVTALLLFAPTYLFKWYVLASGTFLTAIDRPTQSVTITVFSAVVFPLLSLAVLTPRFGVYGVLGTSSVSTALTAAIAFAIWKRTANQLHRLPEQA